MSSTLVDILSNCPIVQLITVNIRNIGHVCKKGTQMHSPCIESSVDTVLVKTSTSCFLS